MEKDCCAIVLNFAEIEVKVLTEAENIDYNLMMKCMVYRVQSTQEVSYHGKSSKSFRVFSNFCNSKIIFLKNCGSRR